MAGLHFLCRRPIRTQEALSRRVCARHLVIQSSYSPIQEDHRLGGHGRDADVEWDKDLLPLRRWNRTTTEYLVLRDEERIAPANYSLQGLRYQVAFHRTWHRWSGRDRLRKRRRPRPARSWYRQDTHSKRNGSRFQAGCSGTY